VLRDDVPVSTTGQSVLVTALVFGIVVAIFGRIYVWEKWPRGTRLEQRIDRERRHR
jgi:hypothetical protein